MQHGWDSAASPAAEQQGVTDDYAAPKPETLKLFQPHGLDRLSQASPEKQLVCMVSLIS